jgi:hypothetical protein
MLFLTGNQREMRISPGAMTSPARHGLVGH